ncbi:hypothetical protein [uncultured Polaribacter sp.]|nr:hypothetical protein [uncultured Polaribacter sp.]
MSLIHFIDASPFDLNKIQEIIFSGLKVSLSESAIQKNKIV